MSQQFKSMVEMYEGHPERWTQGASSRDSSGARLRDSVDPNAVCWCLIGSLSLIYETLESYLEARRKIINVLTGKELLYPDIINYNDNSERTFEEVLQLVKDAGV